MTANSQFRTSKNRRTTKTGKTYADLMQQPTARKPKPVMRPLESQHAPPSESQYAAAVGQPQQTPAPASTGSYADVMMVAAQTIPISDAAAAASLPTPPTTPTFQPLHPDNNDDDDDDRQFPPADALRKSQIPSLELPPSLSDPTSQKTPAKLGEKGASVLFAPAERMCKVSYGGWTGLKGDPVKLERLNQPAKVHLESRWAC